MTWQPGDPIYDPGAASVDTARQMVSVIDDLFECREGCCCTCNHGVRRDDAMSVQFGEQR